jgi:NADH-quinone oxidoreductase subunit N
MVTSNLEILQLMPFIIIGAGIIISLIIEMVSKKSAGILPAVSIISFTVTAVYSILTIQNGAIIFGNMVEVGGKVSIFTFIFTFGASIAVLGSVNYLKKYGAYFGEYYILVQSSVLGMMLMAAAKDIIVVFMGLELMSICFYILVGINRKKVTGNEASMKYFLLGSFATGFIVYGIALIYGMAATTKIDIITAQFGLLVTKPLFVTGMILLIIGFSFKIAAFPFHMWVPDVYQGAGSPLAGLMSTTGKTAAFSVIIILLSAVFTGLPNKFQPYFAGIAVLSTLYGSITAITQSNLKRMLAYSSISHAGYMAIGLAAGNDLGKAGIIFYLAAYTFINLGAFTVISIVEGENDTRTDFDSYAGLSSKSPVLAGFMALFMFALAGIPPMAGFFGKYYVFAGAIKADLTWLALVGILASVISVYFYLKVTVYMYFKPSTENFTIEKNTPGLFAVVFCGLITLAFGFFPDSLLNLITSFLK